jgi:hypothetical protein
MENVKVDQYGNVMVRRADGVWIRDTTLTNKIKNALKRNTTGKIIGETISGVKVTRGLVGQVNKKVLIEQKGRGVTSSLKQETGEKVTWSKSKSFESGQGNVGSGRVKVEGKPLYKDSQYRGTPKGPPKTAAAKAAEAAATEKAGKEAQRLKAPEYEVSRKVTNGKTQVTVFYQGKEDSALKNAMTRILQNPAALKGKEIIKIGGKSVPISVLRDFWKAMPKETITAIAKAGSRAAGPLGVAAVINDVLNVKKSISKPKSVQTPGQSRKVPTA